MENKRALRPYHSCVVSHWCRQSSVGLPGHVGQFIVSFSIPMEEYVMEKVTPALQRIRSEDFTTKFRGLSRLRQLVGKENEEGEIAIRAVFQHNLVPVLLDYMNNYRLQFEAEWTIASLTSAPKPHLQVLFRHQAIKVLMEKLHSSALEAVDQAVWAIGNLAFSYETRMNIIRHGIVPQLCQIVAKCLAIEEGLSPSEILARIPVKKSLLRSSVWTMSRLCGIQYNERPVEWIYLNACLPTLVRVLQESRDDETLSDACCALSNLSEQMSAETILSTGILPRLVSFLHSKCQFIRAPSLRTIGNILAGSEHHTQDVINSGALQSLTRLLMDPSVYLRKASAWAISNIAAGSHDQIDFVLQSGCIHHLINMVRSDEHVAAREASWVISNIITGGSAAHIQLCGEFGCGRALSALLHRPIELDDETVASIAEALCAMFQMNVSFIDNVASLRIVLGELSSDLEARDGDGMVELQELILALEAYLACCDTDSVEPNEQSNKEVDGENDVASCDLL